jgi:hypothetical protein
MKAERRLKFALIVASVALLAGCSRLLPPSRVHSSEFILDTRRDPSEELSGRFIPGVFPAITKVPVFFVESIPNRAAFIGATCETTQQSGEPLAVLKAVIEKNQVYLEFASAKMNTVSQLHVIVHATYRSR